MGASYPLPDARPNPQLKRMNQDTSFLTLQPDRAVLSITGEDASVFLQRVITNGPEGLEPLKAQFSALLTPQGKVLADFIVFSTGQDALFVDVPASEAPALLKRFTMYRMRAKAELALREDLNVATARGEGEQELTTVALAAALDPRNPMLGLRAIIPAGGPDAETQGYHAARIAACVPEFGHDYGPSEVFSTDVNHDLLGGIDYKKGCFVGQEVASRMHRKGGVRKRTLLFRFEDGAPARGTELLAGETPLGELTSVSGPLALARVRVDRLAKALGDGQSLSADSHTAICLDKVEQPS